MNDIKYIEIAYKLAQKAGKNGDVPVGAVIVKNNKIVSKAYNKKNKHNISIEHAEILAIKKACKKLKTWHLDKCILYTTMEPCMMCKGAIIESRIKKVVCCIKNEKYNNILKNKQIEYKYGLLEKKYKELLQNFFKEKR